MEKESKSYLFVPMEKGSHCSDCGKAAGSLDCVNAMNCVRGTQGYYKEVEDAVLDYFEPVNARKDQTVPLNDKMDGPGTDDKKYDAGKPMVGQMKKDFPRALLAVADVTRYGIEKYQKPGSWKEVEDALTRYEDALGRHDLEHNIEQCDKESGRRHAVHRAWNALATLELILLDEGDYNGS